MSGRSTKRGKRFIGVTFNINDRKCRKTNSGSPIASSPSRTRCLRNESHVTVAFDHDPLTRLPNRRLLMERLHQALAARMRNGQTGALLFIDIDNFKILNDTLGHDMGDLLLQQVAKRLEYCVREGDTIARIGGDEFVVMLEDLSRVPLEAAAQTEAVVKRSGKRSISLTSSVRTNISVPPVSARRFQRRLADGRRTAQANRHRHVSGQEGRPQHLALLSIRRCRTPSMRVQRSNWSCARPSITTQFACSFRSRSTRFVPPWRGRIDPLGTPRARSGAS